MCIRDRSGVGHKVLPVGIDKNGFCVKELEGQDVQAVSYTHLDVYKRQEDHRPLYDWVVRECEFENPPRQIEFAKMYLTNVVTGKRYIKKLVEDGIVDGWDDPRLVTIAALRRRGYTPEALRMFVELVGVSKANSSVDYAMLEYCIREDLKLKRPRMMAVLDLSLIHISRYPSR